jgi:NAD(P)-dependent dehydrogenase (short-subunit alcohol dehydrogenase family)
MTGAPYPPGLVVVSGAAGGLGSAVARQLARTGTSLLLLDREPPSELAESLSAAGASCMALGAELRDEASILHALEEGEQQLGQPRHLVHCAAILRMAPIGTLSPEEFRDVLDVNVVGAFLLARAVAASAGADGGALVLVSSTGGIVSGADSMAYGASKHALHGVMQGLAEAFAPAGVRVNVVAPGTMDTPLFGREVAVDWADRFGGLTAEDKLAANRSESLFKELVDVEDIADLCCFLLSRATRAVTGQIYPAWGAPIG